jgi:membrane protease YdiL (CAAX protease family)
MSLPSCSRQRRLLRIVQGPSGMIQTFIVSCALGAIFIRSRHNLLLLILMHGAWDTFSIAVMYLGLKWGV